MTHDEFMEKVKSAKSRLKGIGYYYFFADLSIDYISELESEAKKRDTEIQELKTRLSGKTNYCEACEGMGQEIAKLRKAFGQLIDLHDDCPNYGYGLGEVYDKCPADLLAKYGSGDELCRECWKRFLMGGDK